MKAIEGVFLWCTIGLYLLSFLVYLSGAVFKKESNTAWGWRLFIAAFVSECVTIAARWIASGHPPVLWSYEHALAGSFFAAITLIAIGFKFKAARLVGVAVAPFAMLMIGYGVMSTDLSVEPLPPSYQSNWLWVHVGFAWVAYGAYHVAAGAGVLYLLKNRAVKRHGDNIHRFYSFLPNLESLEKLIFQLIVYGFISHIVMLGSGALWAYGLWGRYWAWDPMEIWTLVSWLIYGVAIHLRVTYKWSGTKWAWLAIAALTGVIIFFGGVGFTSDVHTPLL